MPDLTIEHMRTCSANLFWQKWYTGSGGSKYLVFFGEMSHGPYSHGWVCDCKAFEFGKQKDKDGQRTCKHIEQAKKEKCTWGHEAFCGSNPQPNPDNTCPECGEPTTVIKVGV